MRIESDPIPPDLPLLQKAQENFVCAERAFSNGYYNVAASRYYYAAFTAGKQVLLRHWRKQDEDIPHGGLLVKALQEVLPHQDLWPLFTGLYGLRRTADYQPMLVKRVKLDGMGIHVRAFLQRVFSVLRIGKAS